MIEYQLDWMKIADFLLISHLLASPIFYCLYLKSQPSRNLKLEEVISCFEKFHKENQEISNQKFKTLHWKGKLVQENDETLKEEIEFYKSQSRFYLFATFFLIGLLCIVHINLYLQKHFEIECVVFRGDEKIYCDPQSINSGLKIVRNSQNES